MGGGGVFGGFGDNNGGYAQAMQRNQAQYGQNHPKYRTKACKYFQGPGGCKNGARRAPREISADARPLLFSPRRPRPGDNCSFLHVKEGSDGSQQFAPGHRASFVTPGMRMNGGW